MSLIPVKGDLRPQSDKDSKVIEFFFLWQGQKNTPGASIALSLTCKSKVRLVTFCISTEAICDCGTKMTWRRIVDQSLFEVSCHKS